MIKIITTNKGYIWNYKQLFKNLLITVGVIGFVVAYLYLSNMDYQIFVK